ncbi:FUSC family protein [Sphingobium yanoikuyae]|uniref:FUSC family protein n=1 Tax=Sphingobium yanoikuyae TaxID=13690 RepID=UPI0022DD11A6|nr:FUSC family protein [Sphingobium yanoikuyae]WBQ17597.1 FUSC family protein [Sphingobium yanoikuyae]
MRDTKSLLPLSPAIAQAIRVMVACLITYGIVQYLELQQGAWAIFTLLIVMQGSAGATAGAAIDRLIATIAGAVLGGLVVLAMPHTPLTTGFSLVLVAGVLTFGAVRQPRMRGAALTAAIVLLTRAPDFPVGAFVLDRIIEITLGGVVGVLASRFVLPVRSRNRMIEQFRAVLDAMADLLDAQGNAVESGKPISMAEGNIALRKSLMAAEAIFVDAQREKKLGLVRDNVSNAVPRTLWRLRNSISQMGGLLEHPFPQLVRQAVGKAAAEMLHSQARCARVCAVAMADNRTIALDDEAAAAEAFETAFVTLQQSNAARTLPFDTVGRVFSLAFTLRKMRQDFQDLAARLHEDQNA